MESLPSPSPRRPQPPAKAPELPRVTLAHVYAALLADARSPHTRRARQYDCVVFGEFLGRPPAEACAALLAGGRGRANAIALAFRAAEIARGSAAGSVNRRLTALRKIVSLARRLDLVDWVLDVDSLPCTSYRDTRGPGDDGWRRLWAAAVAAGDAPMGRRNRAVIRLLHDNALRVSEAVGLDVENVDLLNARVAILGKGRSQREWVTINATCIGLLREWLTARGPAPGPLFNTHVRAHAGPRAELLARVAMLREQGRTWEGVAATLNADGMTTPTGMPWNKSRAFKQYFPQNSGGRIV